jgi:hypothetical protein
MRTASGVGMTSRCSFGQLKQAVDGANHRPLASDLVKPTQQELPETPGLLDRMVYKNCHSSTMRIRWIDFCHNSFVLANISINWSFEDYETQNNCSSST